MSMINGHGPQGIHNIEKALLIHMTLHDANSLCKRACKCKLWDKTPVRAERRSKENMVSKTQSGLGKLQGGGGIKLGPS